MSTFQPSVHSLGAIENRRSRSLRRARRNSVRQSAGPSVDQGPGLPSQIRWLDMEDGAQAQVRIWLDTGTVAFSDRLSQTVERGMIEFLDNKYLYNNLGKGSTVTKTSAQWNWKQMMENIADASPDNRTVLHREFPEAVSATAQVRRGDQEPTKQQGEDKKQPEGSALAGAEKPKKLTEKPWFVPAVVGGSLALVGIGAALYFYSQKKA